MVVRIDLCELNNEIIINSRTELTAQEISINTNTQTITYNV